MGRCKIKDFQRLSFSKYDFGMWLFQRKWQAIIYGLSFVFAILCGTWLQTFFLFISFNAVRPCFPKTFHSDEFDKCIKWSIIMFCCSAFALQAFPLSITVCGGLFIGILCCYILHLIECWNINRKEIREYEKPLPFCLDTCTDTELLERCRLKRLSKLQTERALKLFGNNKQSIENIAFSENVEIDSIYKAKQRIKDKLS